MGRPDALVWWPSSIRVGGDEVTGVSVELGVTDLDVTITLTDRRAELNGAVRDSRGQVRPDARVMVFARGPQSMSSCLRQIAPDRFGKFQSGQSFSTDCMLAAVTNPPAAWRSPEYLKSLEPFAVPARVELGATRTIDLTVRP